MNYLSLSMESSENRSQWHDGWFYYYFISPNLKVLYKKIANLIPQGSSVIDIASGVSYLGLSHYDRFLHYTGVDLSFRSIKYAEKIAKKRNIGNMDFLHLNALKLSASINKKYDYSVVCLALHEMPESIRLGVIDNMARVSNNLILVDYSQPLPNNSYSLVVYLSEFFAGVEHFQNFLNYRKNGGLKELVDKSNLEVINEQKSFIRNFTIFHAKSKY